ncbi:MAG: N-acetylmuramoyl-L-alanine amidase [Sulfurospirillaceae bacterium]|nr:N-acetylmuramoyl-L-alanine amidase [Sulfurospirillaceae bacterium]
MEKSIKILFSLLFFGGMLFAGTNYTKQLETYDTQMRNANGDEMLRVFHGLKSIYIHSIITNDDSLKKETLVRLIQCARVLKIDASKYESELSVMNKSTLQSPKVKEEMVFQAPKKTEPILSREKPKKIYNDKTVLHNVVSNNDEIVLEFDDEIKENTIKSFVLKSANSYKQVYDIPSIILSTPKISTPKKLQNLRVSQFSKETIRVVMDNPAPFDSTLSVEGYKVVISLSPQNITKKTASPKNTVMDKTAASKSSAPQPPMKKTIHRDKVIVIDAGHGGKDAGAIGYKQKQEKYLVLDIAQQLAKVLKERGYKVYLTRNRDIFINLRDRTKIANDKNADLFLSIHANAAPNEQKQLSMKGLETFFLSPDRSDRSKNVAALENKSDMEDMNYYSKETFLNVLNREKIVLSNKAAIDIQKGMLHSAKQKYDVDDGGVREAPFWVLVGATMPSVLIEVGYITNPEESSKLFNLSYQRLLVEGISDGIDKYFVNNP